MSEPKWPNDLGTAVNLQSVAGLVLGTLGTAVYQNLSPNPDTLLDCCRKELDEIKARINEIPAERRDQIQVVVERGACKSFQELETTLLGSVSSTAVYVRVFKAFHMSRLSDDHCELKERSKNTPAWKRHLPATQLRADIKTLKDGLKRLSTDTCVRGNISFPMYSSVYILTGHNKRPQESSASVPTIPHATNPHEWPRYIIIVISSHESSIDCTFSGHHSSGQPGYPLGTLRFPSPVHVSGGGGQIAINMGVI